MSVEQRHLRTARGDDVVVTLFMHAGEAPSIMLTVDDGDDTVRPTVEFTIAEAAEFRDVLRQFSERSVVVRARF